MLTWSESKYLIHLSGMVRFIMYSCVLYSYAHPPLKMQTNRSGPLTVTQDMTDNTDGLVNFISGLCPELKCVTPTACKELLYLQQIFPLPAWPG